MEPAMRLDTLMEAIRIHSDSGIFNTPQVIGKTGRVTDQEERDRLAQLVRQQRARRGGVQLDTPIKGAPGEKVVASNVDDVAGRARISGILRNLQSELKTTGVSITEVLPVNASTYKFRLRAGTRFNEESAAAIVARYQAVIRRGGGELNIDPNMRHGVIKLVGLNTFRRKINAQPQ